MTFSPSFQKFLSWERSTRDTLDVKKIYMDIAGDPMAGIALSEILYWYLPDRNGQSNKLRIEKPAANGQMYSWIAVRRYEWWDRCRFSPEQADYAIRKLIERGLIEKKVFKFDGEPTVHLRMVEEVFLREFSRLTSNPPINPHLPKQAAGSELGKFPKPNRTPPPENAPNWENSQNELGEIPNSINIDYSSPPPPPTSANADEIHIPQTIAEAAKHPDLALYRAITGFLPDSRNDWRAIMDYLALIRRERPGLSEEELAADGAAYWREWHEARGYRNPDWLSWWTNRRIPEQRRKRQAQQKSPPQQPAPAPVTPKPASPPEPPPDWVLKKADEIRRSKPQGDAP